MAVLSADQMTTMLSQRMESQVSRPVDRYRLGEVSIRTAVALRALRISARLVTEKGSCDPMISRVVLPHLDLKI